MKSKKIPRKFIKKPKVIEIAKSPPGIFARLIAIRIPSITLIPEKELVVGFICGCLVVGIAMSSFRLIENVKTYEAVLVEKNTLLLQREYWQDIVTRYPTYRDAHFRLGVLAYQEGRKQEAKVEVAKALDIDPSFVEARMFLQKIEK